MDRHNIPTHLLKSTRYYHFKDYGMKSHIPAYADDLLLSGNSKYNLKLKKMLKYLHVSSRYH